MMVGNEGAWDRVVRILLAIACGFAAWMSWPGAVGVVFLVIAAVALVTGLLGWCPAYTLFGCSTRKVRV